MDEKELETDADMQAKASMQADADVKAAVADNHTSTNPADMDPIDYIALLMEQEHR